MEWGLAAVVVLAPLPFGSVLPGSLLALELGALALLVPWLLRAVWRETALPPRVVRVGAVGLLALAMLQVVPLGRAVTSLVSPMSVELRDDSRPGAAILETEEDLLDTHLAGLDRPATLSVDPELSASALRTGAALVALLLVATTVASARGVRVLCLALLVSAAGQALYGVLVLASGHDMIWNVPKRHYLDSATGTFVNRNHFAAYLNAALCAGLALTLRRAGRAGSGRTRRRLLELLGPEGSRALLLGLLVVLGLSGLLLSFSRAGIAIGLAALALTVIAAGRFGIRARVAVILLLVATAAIPLSQVGSGRLAERYSQTVSDFAGPGARATVWRDTLGMAGAFPATGSGFGTFATAYPLFRSAEVRLFFRHAHNDAVQALAEGGVLGGVLALLVVAPLLARIAGGLRGRGGALGAGIAAGLLALLVHSLVDFPLHIPALAATASVLAGALMGLPWKEPRSSS